MNMHTLSRKKDNIIQIKNSLFASLSVFFHIISCFVGLSIPSIDFIKKMSCVCCWRQAGDRRKRKGANTEREKKQEKILTKAENEGGKKIPAIAYFYESEYMNIEESNDYEVQNSKCFPYYQAETINMKLVCKY